MAITLIYVRKYRPLSISFPPPGVYVGHIKIILPASDPTILSRLSPGGSAPTVLEVDTIEPIHAYEILDVIRDETRQLKAISESVAQPILEALLRHFQLSKKRGKLRVTKVGGVDNPLESIQD